MRAALFLAVPLLLANAEDPTIPAPIKTMLDAAMASGNDGDVSVIVKYARTADPASAELVERIASNWRNDRSANSTRTLREANFFDLVKGRAELGGYINTGNSDNVGLSANAELRREGLEWRHKLRLQADYQKDLDIVTRERFLAAYEPNWKFDDRAYLYGAAQYERDRFSGFYDRISISSGVGYSAIKSPAIKLDLELGPAYRRTSFIDDYIESNIAARGSIDFGWKLSPGISVTQTASAYIQDANSTITSKSALLARLIGPLSAQLSYNVQYESLPPVGRKNQDTTSRASLVLDF
jgi:putative salt-induced outer membrane protein